MLQILENVSDIGMKRTTKKIIFVEKKINKEKSNS
jgi:hypothetical protein